MFQRVAMNGKWTTYDYVFFAYPLTALSFKKPLCITYINLKRFCRKEEEEEEAMHKVRKKTI